MRICFLFAVLFTLLGSVAAADWPQWRGPSRDGWAGRDEKLAAEAVREPKRLWKLPIGGGFSSPIIFGDSVIYLDENEGKEVAHCVELISGKERWRLPYADVFQDEWGAGPRSTPFTDGEKVFFHSCNGEFRCVDFKSGKVIWGFSFGAYGVEFLGSKAQEGTATRRGNNGSGILDGDSVIVPVGSKDGATLVCLKKEDGVLRWKSGNDEAAYSSPVVANIAGARQVVALTADYLAGYDRISGRQLWAVRLVTNAKRHAMTPIIEGNRIYVNSHTFGLICYEIVNEGGSFKAMQKWKNAEAKINVATPVLIDGFLYSHGANKNFICVDAKTGAQRWSQAGFGQQYSSTLAVGNSLLVISDFGEAVLLRPSPEKYDEIARGQLAAKNWNHPALGRGKLVVRDQRELNCYEASP
ncbi:MAG TPA: PQQ-binding-like beta-propeller repeat protein [Verrucomicrobiae bacterium]|nr:PQQ-binding-like beta-propeller repeat protein [Verrucomicrobiae bacterium]